MTPPIFLKKPSFLFISNGYPLVLNYFKVEKKWLIHKKYHE